jgi:hypothetical protein
LTLRELAAMAEARRRFTWGAVSSVMALLANLNRNPKKRSRPFTPADFDPTKPQAPPITVTVSELKDLFSKCRKSKPARPTSSSRRATRGSSPASPPLNDD